MVKSTHPIHDNGLADEEAIEILEFLDDEMIDETSPELRRADRQFKIGTATVIGMDTEPADVRVHLRNVSQAGLAFVCRFMFKPGTRIDLQLPAAANRDDAKKKAVVVRCRHIRDSIFEVGAEFTDA